MEEYTVSKLFIVLYYILKPFVWIKNKIANKFKKVYVYLVIDCDSMTIAENAIANMVVFKNLLDAKKYYEIRNRSGWLALIYRIDTKSMKEIKYEK